MMSFKACLAFVPAWAFFWAGDLASRLIAYFGHDSERLFSLYNWCMTVSMFFNDWGGLDVWTSNGSDDYEDAVGATLLPEFEDDQPEE